MIQRKISYDELQEIINKHKKWMLNEPNGERADLSNTNLAEADLSDIDLSGAYLYCSNLAGADLSRSVFFRTNLFNCNLSNATLFQTNLSGADLSFTFMFYADLNKADLYNANLYGADLMGANLSHTCVKAFQINKYFGYCWLDPVERKIISKIGCQEYPLDEWLENKCQSLGQANSYSLTEIKQIQIILKAIKEVYSLENN